jgi:hypothetical protein
MYVCGWPPHPALILSPIEHFEITSLDLIQAEAEIWVTGQFSTHAPQPVHKSMLMLRARLRTLTLNLPGLP